MLKTVKNLVDEPVEPFGTYYINYVMQVQDQNIDRELRSLLHNNRTDISSMGKLIDEVYKSIQNGVII